MRADLRPSFTLPLCARRAEQAGARLQQILALPIMCANHANFGHIVYNLGSQQKKITPLPDRYFLQIYGCVAPLLRGHMNG